LSGEDLKDLEHASKTEVGPWFQLVLGAVIGNAVSTILALRDLSLAEWSPKKMESFEPLVVLGCETLFVGAAVAFGIVSFNARGKSVSDICRKIRQRPKQNGDGT